MKNIKVVIVDDSALMRRIISDMINSTDDMEVIASCKNGEELILRLPELNPDVITLDVEMPVMDGLRTLKELKRRSINIPTIILSGLSQTGTELSLECLELGAFDVVLKPSGTISVNIDKVKDELLAKIKIASERKVRNFRVHNKNIGIVNERKPVVETKFQENKKFGKIDAVVIAASTGGPQALSKVIMGLPKKVGVPIFIVQHMPVGFTKAFAQRLNTSCNIAVVEAYDNQVIEKDVVYIAPGGFHMEVGGDNKIHLNTEPTMWGVRPAADKLFISATKAYKDHLLSVVLTGMGRDGANGTAEVKNNGGITISQDEFTSTIYGMPKVAYETGKVDFVCPIDKIAMQIMKIIN